MMHTACKRPDEEDMQNWTRRQALAGFVIAAKLAAQRPSNLPNEDCIDAHVHVWEPANARFPYDPAYDGPKELPTTFTPSNLLSIAQPVGVKRIVLVQMSFYGTDNSYMLDAIKLHPSKFSGIAVVDRTSLSLSNEMSRLRTLGVRGFRIAQGNHPAGWLEMPDMRRLWSLAAEKQMVVCSLVNPAELSSLDRMCADFPETTLAIDHIARIGMAGPVRDVDVAALCRLSRHPRVHVKVSAFYALGKQLPPYNDLVPLISALYDSYGPHRLMWGSDSPYQVQPPHTYGASLDLVRNGLPFLSPQDKAWLLGKSAQSVFF